MAHCEACNEISDDVVFISLENFILFTEFVGRDYFFLDIF
jgi:hypothetical protein